MFNQNILKFTSHETYRDKFVCIRPPFRDDSPPFDRASTGNCPGVPVGERNPDRVAPTYRESLEPHGGKSLTAMSSNRDENGNNSRGRTSLVPSPPPPAPTFIAAGGASFSHAYNTRINARARPDIRVYYYYCTCTDMRADARRKICAHNFPAR